ATGFDNVWVRDVTEEIQADKRGHGDQDLPDLLKFYIRRGLDSLTLNLIKNYEIDPNADIYVVQELKNGRSVLAKVNDKEKEVVAYYQDIANMAFVTVRCVSRSNHKCDRVINGNVRIGDCNYDLRPAESDFPSDQTSDILSVIGKRYILLDYANVDEKDAANSRATNIEEDLYVRLKHFREKDQFRSLEATLSKNVADLQDTWMKEIMRRLRNVYYVKVAVLIDSGVYDLYASSIHSADSLRKSEKVRQKIRESYSHIINGEESHFPHKSSRVVINNGKKYINSHPYTGDIKQWVKKFGIHMVPEFDHAMLFTGYEMYKGSVDNTVISGVSPVAGVCDVDQKVSLVQAGHYSRSVLLATHELGHNLGAHHDGTEEAKDCSSDDGFIMSYRSLKFNGTTPYSRNPWIFSHCSVESFKKVLIT
ncbi:hypothetical protein ACJMK2_004354, partial [Sinanodonta woodiana]